ncbi:MAG: SMP-30/gluconolactonase/LRE family protein [Thermoleophilia bacterium]|nr:SMP-30/gluconolactonase/LRE family protein [Thermoleophilia bacterium]
MEVTWADTWTRRLTTLICAEWTHPLPVRRPTNCTFGDTDLRSLYVTTSDGLVFRARGKREGLLLFPTAK